MCWTRWSFATKRAMRSTLGVSTKRRLCHHKLDWVFTGVVHGYDVEVVSTMRHFVSKWNLSFPCGNTVGITFSPAGTRVSSYRETTVIIQFGNPSSSTALRWIPSHSSSSTKHDSTFHAKSTWKTYAENPRTAKKTNVLTRNITTSYGLWLTPVLPLS